MSNVYYERLSALDASILRFEERNAHWHEAAVMLFDAGPLRTADGGLDFERILNNYQWSIESVPRYRQRTARVPFLEHPVWVDDASFNVRYHIRQIALPQPADERVLKRVCGYLLELPLDMQKPPWEAWIVDGLPGDQFALLLHQCHYRPARQGGYRSCPYGLVERRQPHVVRLGRGPAHRQQHPGLALFHSRWYSLLQSF